MRFADGTEIAHSTYRRGSTENPVGTDGLTRKFLDLAGSVLDGSQARSTLEDVMRLAELSELGELTAALGGVPS